MIDGPIPEALTFDDVLLLPGKSVGAAHAGGHAHVPLAQDRAEHSDRRRRDGHGHRCAAGHRHRAARRHRIRPPQHDHRPPGRGSGPREALGKRHDRRSGDDCARDVRAAGARHHEQVQGVGPAGHARRSAWSASSRTAICASSAISISPSATVMTKDNLVTVPVGTTLEEAERILQRHRIEKLLVVDKDFNLKGLITVKDIQKKIEFPERDKRRAGPPARRRGHRRDGRFPGARRGNGARKSGRAGDRHGARPHAPA